MIYQCPKCHLFVMAQGNKTIFCDRFGCSHAKMTVIETAVEPRIFKCECGARYTVRYKGNKPVQSTTCPHCESTKE